MNSGNILAFSAGSISQVFPLKVHAFLCLFRYDPDHMTSLKTHRRIELVEESRRMLDRVVKALLERYRADPGVDKKLLSDIRTIFVEDLKDEV